MTQHTPGPWFTVTVAGKHGRNKRGIGTGNYQVCQIHVGSRNGELDETQMANAELIAAAPETATERDRLRKINAELLAALEMTERFFSAHADRISAHCGTGFKPTRRTVRAAIARAEGEGK